MRTRCRSGLPATGPLAVLAAGVLATGVLVACASTTSGTPHGVAQPHTIPPPTSRTPVSTPPAKTSPGKTKSPTTSPGTRSKSTSPGGTTHPVPAKPLRTKYVSVGPGYAVSIWAQTLSTDCAAHAYGQVAQFVATHKCTGIRQILGTTQIHGRAVGFAQNTVGFVGGMDASYKSAGEFEQLVTKDGTGNLNDLLREGYRLPAGPTHVPVPDAFQALGQDNGVSVTDAWFLTGTTPENAKPLITMAKSIFLQL